MRLEVGNTVGVVATGFRPRPAAVAAGIGFLRRCGYRVVAGRSLAAALGYLAGNDRQRAADLNRMLRDPRIRAVWFARGGYGTARILDRVDWEALRRDPKVLVGYSDLTALFAAAGRSAACVYGPVVAELGDPRAYHAGSLDRAMAGAAYELHFAPRGVLRPGRGRGPLLGGNLTVLAHLAGTPYAPDLRGAIVALEDAGEEVYRVDRMLHHLRAAGAFDAVAGVVLGRFQVPRRARAFPPDRALVDVVREALRPLGVPVAAGLPFGHVAAKRALALGVEATLDTRRGVLALAARAK